MADFEKKSFLKEYVSRLEQSFNFGVTTRMVAIGTNGKNLHLSDKIMLVSLLLKFTSPIYIKRYKFIIKGLAVSCGYDTNCYVRM